MKKKYSIVLFIFYILFAFSPSANSGKNHLKSCLSICLSCFRLCFNLKRHDSSEQYSADNEGLSTESHTPDLSQPYKITQNEGAAKSPNVQGLIDESEGLSEGASPHDKYEKAKMIALDVVTHLMSLNDTGESVAEIQSPDVTIYLEMTNNPEGERILRVRTRHIPCKK